jgi:hypothetical protein
MATTATGTLFRGVGWLGVARGRECRASKDEDNRQEDKEDIFCEFFTRHFGSPWLPGCIML